MLRALASSTHVRYILFSALGYLFIYMTSSLVNGLLSNENLAFLVSYSLFFMIDFVGTSRFVYGKTPRVDYLWKYMILSLLFLVIGILVFQIVKLNVDNQGIASVLTGLLMSPFRMVLSRLWVFNSNHFTINVKNSAGEACRNLSTFLKLTNKSKLKENRGLNEKFIWLKSLLGYQNLELLIYLDVAWWPFRVQKEIDEMLSKMENAEVFEWGSGASTIWLSKRVKRVITVEHDPDFVIKMKSFTQDLMLHNIQIVQQSGVYSKSPAIISAKKGFQDLDFAKYVNEIKCYGFFDLIVIDGRARSDCLMVALDCLKPGGVILLDNSNRKRYRRNMNGLEERIIKGLTPASLWVTQSSIVKPKIGKT